MKKFLSFLVLIVAAIAAYATQTPIDVLDGATYSTAGMGLVLANNYDRVYNELATVIPKQAQRQVSTLKLAAQMVANNNIYRLKISTANNGTMDASAEQLIQNDAFIILGAKVGYANVASGQQLANQFTYTYPTSATASEKLLEQAIYSGGRFNILSNNKPLVQDYPMDRFQVLQPGLGNYGNIEDTSFVPLQPSVIVFGGDDCEVNLTFVGDLSGVPASPASKYLIVELYGIRVLGGNVAGVRAALERVQG